LGYQNLNYYAKEFTFDGQLGKVYNNAQLMARISTLQIFVGEWFIFFIMKFLLNISLLLGVSSINILGYQNLNYYAKEFTFDGQLGKVYNNAQLMARIDVFFKVYHTGLKIVILQFPNTKAKFCPFIR